MLFSTKNTNFHTEELHFSHHSLSFVHIQVQPARLHHLGSRQKVEAQELQPVLASLHIQCKVNSRLRGQVQEGCLPLMASISKPVGIYKTVLLDAV